MSLAETPEPQHSRAGLHELACAEDVNMHNVIGLAFVHNSRNSQSHE